MSTRDPEPVDETDDEALHWAGDEARGQSAPRLRDDADAVGAPAEPAPDDEPAEAPRTPRETAFLVGTGAFGVVYLALSIGWIFSAQLLSYPGLDTLGEIMWQFGEFLAMIAAALWFAAAITLTPDTVSRRAAKRMIALLVGALVLIPWPGLLYWIGSTQ
ncbi:hypothetical protein [Protaetiibacter mangrovi]|uniref:DNA polymerase III subunit gamma/tau n=1 Tax=Protaetiibacter mangrovi TaxID=2970926 RepID=A0ABT1ZHS6_9MICO|nr:hypothetical protein [Protaetiibacter mangrovi]MCS0500280.1 hypothetical protein [Protaetiibacter mangrovi]TPX02427.1 hypothetical protein FJ656_22445 [Schumannella luteola]